MTAYKTRLQSEKEIQRMLQESASEGDDDVMFPSHNESPNDHDTLYCSKQVLH